jgi:hypothetical protein
MYKTKDYFPPYYHVVTIYYKEKGKSDILINKAWLAVDDDNRHIWTLENSNCVILDKQVIDWDVK